MLKLLFSTLLLAALAAGCESGSGTAATSLHFRSRLITDGELPVPRDPNGGTLIGIYGKDDSGKVTTPAAADIKCESSDKAVALIGPLGTAVIVTALSDRFDSRPATEEDDAGADPDGGVPTVPYDAEPEAIITCRANGLSASITMRGIVNGAGTWRIEAAGINDAIELEQNGRELFVPGTTEPAGRIDDDVVTLKKDGLTLTGSLDARDSASGMVGPVEWRARKDP